MSELKFISGVMSSSKTITLLNEIFDLKKQNRKFLLIKPAVDNRFGNEVVSSRCGTNLEKADYVADTGFNFLKIKDLEDFEFMFIDEAQFLTPQQIDQIKEITVYYKINICCYGLLLDFQTHLFPASKRLLELCTEHTETKKICMRCNKVAKYHLRLVDDIPVFSGEVVVIEGVVKYESVCYHCFREAFNSTVSDLEKNK